MDFTFGFLGVGLNGTTLVGGTTSIDFGAHLSNGTITAVYDHMETIVDAASSIKQIKQSSRYLAKLCDLQIGFAYTF